MKKLISILLSVILTVCMATTAFAKDAISEIVETKISEAIVLPEEFEAFETHGNINQSDQYYFDVADPGIMDMIGTMITNSQANGVFETQILVVKITCTLFYQASTIDFASWINSLISPVQKNFKEKLFDGAVTFAIGLALLGIAGVILKRNYPEVLSRLTQIVALCVMASLLSKYSMDLISQLNTINNAICNAIVAGVSQKEASGDYNLDTVDTLWRSLIHEPWRTLEFDKYNPGTQFEEDLLDGSLPKDSKNRQKKINEINEESEDSNEAYIPFGPSLSSKRLFFLYFYYLPLAARCFIYAVIALAQCLLKIVTVLLVLMGMIVLLAAILPWFGGMKLAKNWGLKILQIQVTTWLLSFFCSFVVLMDNMIYINAKKSGWIVVIILQVAMILGIIIYHKAIFGFIFKAPGKLLHQSGTDLSKVHASDVGGAIGDPLVSAASSVSATAGHVQSTAYNKMVDVGSGIYNKAAEMGAAARDTISGYFDLSSEDSNESGKTPAASGTANRPSLNLPLETLGSGGTVTAETPRPILPGTHSTSTAQNPDVTERSNDTQVYTIPERPESFINGNNGVTEQPEAPTSKEENVVGYDNLQERPKLNDETLHAQEIRPTTNEGIEADSDIKSQNKPQNDRSTAANELTFDMGQFEPREMASDNELKAKRPVLEEVS